MNLFVAYNSILVTFTTVYFFFFFLHHFLKSKSPFMNTIPFIIITKFNTLSTSLFPSKKDEDGADESRRSFITASDALVVMRRLGLWRGDEYCEDAGVFEGAYRLLEEKEASLEELEEAFAVFDEDGDGVISANELRIVLKRLGFREGIGLEECRGMIRNFDLDGDGRIGFKEFKSLLEQAS
ncbi:calmodulin-like protein 7 [Dendrobium catenatum]|uniref:Putative calcium-binding protein CML30 n=1 Tax=Dendrobium catenatum TaxID=906689 RepID=A0A2I0WSJ4_9ASPA|nr:calmodulin-like protein 7 [Dendrobium catenatum]PKU78616.1 putative calcium-binding protein CML30 [Dendrobium catenatum]